MSIIPDRFRESPFLGLSHLFTDYPELSGKTPSITISTSEGQQPVTLQLADAPRDMVLPTSGPKVTFDIHNDQEKPHHIWIGGSWGYANDEVQFVHYLDNKCLYLSPNLNGSMRVPASKLWEQIDIAGREAEVINSLRLIESGIEKVFFIGSGSPRIPVCRIKGQRPVPLHNLGDGVSRLFELILGIVNVAGGICLIDEFENGLHWSVPRTSLLSQK